MASINPKWAPGFSRRADQERIRNRAELFPTDRVRATMARNAETLRPVLEETLDSIEEDCKPD